MIHLTSLGHQNTPQLQLYDIMIHYEEIFTLKIKRISYILTKPLKQYGSLCLRELFLHHFTHIPILSMRLQRKLYNSTMKKKRKCHYVSGLTRKFMGRWQFSILFQSVYLWVSLKEFQKLPLTLKTSSTFTYLILNDQILT